MPQNSPEVLHNNDRCRKDREKIKLKECLTPFSMSGEEDVALPHYSWQVAKRTSYATARVCGSPSSLAACSHNSSVIRAFPFTLSPTSSSFSAVHPLLHLSLPFTCNLACLRLEISHHLLFVDQTRKTLILGRARSLPCVLIMWRWSSASRCLNIVVNDMYRWSDLGQRYQHLSISFALFPPNWSQELNVRVRWVIYCVIWF